ncbi:MAG: hypothetical protein IJ130_01670 [Solobacterium sp.]|nr:hypothetical protein [Solobacterium sp.]
MMNKRRILAGILGGLMFLSACNKDYTLDDAKKYNRTRLGIYWPKLISEEQLDEDTVWTFQERNPRGLQYHIVEDHYTTGIDSASWEASRMYSDYDGMITAHYIEDYQDLHAQEAVYGQDENGIFRDPELKYVFHNRDELEDALRDAGKFVKYVRKKNGRFYTSKTYYDISACMEFEGPYNYSEKYNAGSADPEEAAMDFLSFALAYYDEEQLSYYSASEIRTCMESEDARICLKKGDQWVKTDIVTLRGNTLVFPKALYHLLKEEGIAVQGTPDSYTFTGKDGMTYGPYEGNEHIYFSKLKKILGCDVQGEWNVSE